MKPLSEMPQSTQTSPPPQTSSRDNTSAKLLFISKVGQIDISVKSQIYREIFAGQRKTDVISIVNVIDREDQTKYKLVCTTFLERELLRFGQSLPGKNLRITNKGKEPGKNWYRIEVVDLDAVAQQQRTTYDNLGVSDKDLGF